jgi:SAM-dependent methyltransferase
MGAGSLFVRQVSLEGRRKLMDIGGGSGAYCIQACRRWPELRAEVLDLPPVIVVTREFLAENGLEDRIAATPCDFNHDPFPTDADVAVMASNLPMYGRDAFAAVVTKVHGALLPGGEFHLIGETLNAERTGPADAALWGLAQTINATTGHAHSVAEVEGYFRAAGFTGVTTSDFVPGVLTRTVGSKRA